MRRFGMLIVYLVVAAAVFVAIGTADLRSQAHYAAKMNAPTLISKSMTVNANSIALQKFKDKNHL